MKSCAERRASRAARGCLAAMRARRGHAGTRSLSSRFRLPNRRRRIGSSTSPVKLRRPATCSPSLAEAPAPRSVSRPTLPISFSISFRRAGSRKGQDRVKHVPARRRNVSRRSFIPCFFRIARVTGRLVPLAAAKQQALRRRPWRRLDRRRGIEPPDTAASGHHRRDRRGGSAPMPLHRGRARPAFRCRRWRCRTAMPARRAFRARVRASREPARRRRWRIASAQNRCRRPSAITAWLLPAEGVNVQIVALNAALPLPPLTF